MSVRRPLLKTLVTVATILALLVPIAVALATGWIEVTFAAWGDEPAPDTTPVEAWVALALVYLVWAPLVLVALVWAFDRLGYKYTPHDRAPRPTRIERRRRGAGMKYLQSREAPPSVAPKVPPTRATTPPKDGD